MKKRVSFKRAAEERKYSKQRKIFLSKNTTCKAALKGCSFEATQVHHQAGRVGNLLLDESLWLPICHNCHVIVEQRPQEAKALGLSVSRLNIKINED